MYIFEHIHSRIYIYICIHMWIHIYNRTIALLGSETVKGNSTVSNRDTCTLSS